jgi:CDP-diglyceride synthetase
MQHVMQGNSSNKLCQRVYVLGSRHIKYRYKSAWISLVAYILDPCYLSIHLDPATGHTHQYSKWWHILVKRRQFLHIYANASNLSYRFLFPCSLVICNDTFAYVVGRYFGKRRLLNLSPSKTLEGFIGGFIFTLTFGYYVSTLYYTFAL